MKITAADQSLLSPLRENARASTAGIARRLKLSRTTVQSRIDRLERARLLGGPPESPGIGPIRAYWGLANCPSPGNGAKPLAPIN
ncbi:AsnC family transcriptional regulator [Lysobacter pythonis]|uniref:AsnC family transcriptional regulator n=1 Tax=Solilutibacter pythonis TaxID=2483112 RepID=A0A3M2HV26_9GAMM|nr:AsnC family transcriptional regulator [Lysobacter pythonis]